MNSDANPYQTPDDGEATVNIRQRFENWSNPRLVALFFVPALLLALTLLTSRATQQLILSGVILAFLASIAVSIISAYIHTVRQEAHWGTFALFTFVYLLAQTFAHLLCTATLWVFVTRF